MVSKKYVLSTISQSFLVGVISSIVSNLMVEWRTRTAIDDTLDVFPCHGVGGMTGMLLTGVFAHKQINPAVTDNGLFYDETKLFVVHLIAMVVVAGFTFFGTLLLLKITYLVISLQVTEEEEKEGFDWSRHR